MKVNIPDKLYKAIKRRAALEKKAVDEVILEALEFYYFMDRSLIANAEKLAPAFNVMAADVISHAAIQSFALNEATIEVYGQPLDMFKRLFVWEKADGDEVPKLITGTDLFHNLKDNFVRRLKEEAKADDSQGQ